MIAVSLKVTIKLNIHMDGESDHCMFKYTYCKYPWVVVVVDQLDAALKFLGSIYWWVVVEQQVTLNSGGSNSWSASGCCLKINLWFLLPIFFLMLLFILYNNKKKLSTLNIKNKNQYVITYY